MITSIEENKAIVQQWFDALNAGDVDALKSLYTDTTIVWTAGSTSISGEKSAQHLLQTAGEVLALFPEGLQFSVQQVTAEENRVAVAAESHGKHVSGDIYHNLYHFLLSIEDGKIVYVKEYMDTEHMKNVLLQGDGG